MMIDMHAHWKPSEVADALRARCAKEHECGNDDVDDRGGSNGTSSAGLIDHTKLLRMRKKTNGVAIRDAVRLYHSEWAEVT